MSRPPRIAISATIRSEDGIRRIRVNAAYAQAIERAGGVPFVVGPLGSLAHAETIIDGADGLLLTGGEDVDPARYDAPRHPSVEVINPERDATEIELIEAARARGVPVLAVCRGLQILNVAFGGTLIQDIPTERSTTINHDPAGSRSARIHGVDLETGSRLARAVGKTHLDVNSFHHQAADRVGDGLRATAWSPDELIEGLEWTGDEWWAVAIQWHPEEMVVGAEPAPDAGLFAEFVRRAGAAAPAVS